MKRDNLEQYIGKQVLITLFNGDSLKGYLFKTHTEIVKNNLNLYIPQNYYFVSEYEDPISSTSCIFRLSHIRKFQTL